MAEYIERKALLKFLRKQAAEAQEIAEENGGESIIYTECLEDVLEDVERFPVADVAPVRHGEWRRHYRSGTTPVWGFVSSCCNMWNDRKSDWCPNCGTKMDGAE